jgi:glycosyltransferase involved in cell wall biosynthesis
MPDELQDLFWTYHGPAMEKLGYTRDGHLVMPDPELEHEIYRKLGADPPQPDKKFHVLIEANKMATRDNDGVKRYVATLIDGMVPLTSNENGKWHIDLLINDEIIPLKDYALRMEKSFSAHAGKDEGQEIIVVHKQSLFERMEAFMRGLVPDRWIKWLVDNKILVFHKTYDFVKRAIFAVVFWIQQGILFIFRLLFTIYLRYRQHLELKAISDKIARYDLIHVPLQQHYWPFKYTQVPLVFTIHDFTHSLFPGFHTGINIKNAKNGLKMIMKKKAHVIAVSQSTLNDSKKFLALPPENFHLVYEATEEENFLYQVNKDESGKVREKYGIPKLTPFILLLSTIEPRKNLPNSIHAFQQLLKKHPGLDLHLVISGKQGWKMKKVVGYTTRIFFTGFVDDKDLSALFSEALALSYVSFYEGFGLPLLEAMRCGTPVIYGNNSSMPEVAGEGGLAANAASVEDIRDKYEQIYFNKELRESLSRKAMKQSLKFSSRQSTLKMLETYEKIIKNV